MCPAGHVGYSSRQRRVRQAESFEACRWHALNNAGRGAGGGGAVSVVAVAGTLTGRAGLRMAPALHKAPQVCAMAVLDQPAARAALVVSLPHQSAAWFCERRKQLPCTRRGDQ